MRSFSYELRYKWSKVAPEYSFAHVGSNDFAFPLNSLSSRVYFVRINRIALLLFSMFGWVIIFFTGAAVYFLRAFPRSRLHTRLGFMSVFIAAYLGGMEMWMAIFLKAITGVTSLL